MAGLIPRLKLKTAKRYREVHYQVYSDCMQNMRVGSEKFMIKILCWLGIHKWFYPDSDEWFEYRQCERCDRKERAIYFIGGRFHKVPTDRSEQP